MLLLVDEPPPGCYGSISCNNLQNIRVAGQKLVGLPHGILESRWCSCCIIWYYAFVLTYATDQLRSFSLFPKINFPPFLGDASDSTLMFLEDAGSSAAAVSGP